MKRLIVAAAMIVSVPLSAHADQMVYTYYDTIRPGGHKRPDAIGNANIATCDERAGVQYGPVSDAYKDCMRGLGYRFTSERLQMDGPAHARRHVSHSRPSQPAAARSSPIPEIGGSHAVQ